MFRMKDGRAQANVAVAELILHEPTHCYFKVGTVSVPKTIRYYAEAILLLRYRRHSMEALPFQTSGEFYRLVRDHAAGQREMS